MPHPNTYFSPPSVEELLDKLLRAMGMTRKISTSAISASPTCNA